MKSFVRVTTLTSISGRAGYITNVEKQEEIVIESESVDWAPYEKFESENRRCATANNAGREVVIALPNEWYQLDRSELHQRIDTMAKLVAGDREHQWAVHWNKDRTNLHVHIIFSERQKIAEPGVWDRNVYASKDGKVARRKADRAVDENGEYILIHRKGEAKEPFSAKDCKFATREWLHEIKQDLKQTMIEQWGVKFEWKPPLHEFHEGKGSDAPTIRMKNEVIRENNYRLGVMESQRIKTADFVQELKAILKDGNVPLLLMDKEQNVRIVTFDSPERAAWRIEETRGRFAALDRSVPAQTAPEPQQAADLVEPERMAPAPAEPVQKPQKPAPAVQKDDQEQERVAPAPAATKLPEQPSSKKEDTKEPAAPVERRGLMAVIRDLIAAIGARRAKKTAAEKQAEPVPMPIEPVPEPVVVVQPAPEPQQASPDREKERYQPLDERIEAARKTSMPSEKAIRMEDWKARIEAERAKEKPQQAAGRSQKKTHDRDDR